MAEPSQPLRESRKLRLGVVFAFAATLVLLLCSLRPQSEPVPSPVALLARKVELDVRLLRWLWWPIIVYLFWGMAHVCDIYFVSAIDVITKRFNISEDVAGATLMALGCNGPEMSLNLIAIWQPSNIGVGAVIGGEVFNVLVIIGTALLATPDEYMPLQLGKFSFGRDVSFYCLSVALLYYALHDEEIGRQDVAILLSGGAVYVLVVIYSTKLRRFFHGLLARRKLARDLSRALNSKAELRRDGESGVYSENSESDLSNSAVFRMSPMLNPRTNEPDPIKVRYWNDASHCNDPYSGTVLKVKVDMHNRLMDRGHKSDERYVILMESALMVSTLIDPRSLGGESRCASGMVFDREKSKSGSLMNGDSAWHHGGLVNPPKTMSKHHSLKDTTHLSPTASMSQSLLSGDLELPQMFKASPWEVIPLEDIIWMDRPVERKRFNLHVTSHDSELAHMLPIATLEFQATDEEIVDSWAQALKAGLLRHRQGRGMGPPTQSASGLAIAWLEWLQFPIKSFTALSIPDVSREDLEYLYPLAFVMSMLWLAVFAYCVVAACDGIHEDFGISTSVLGYTIAAAGTSFPNVFSGMCVARQGKTTMAVANALGANVQNVFLALAIPWAVQCCINRGSFNMPFNNLSPAVVEIYVTLLPVVSVFVFCHGTFPRWSGYLFLLIYAAYLAVALTQDISHCPWWPLDCPKDTLF